MVGRTVLILGGGIGGIATANSLRDQLGPEHRVVVVDKQADYVFTPSLLWVMVGWRQPKQITKSLHRLVRPGVEIVVAEGQEIDVESQRVKTGAADLSVERHVATVVHGQVVARPASAT